MEQNYLLSYLAVLGIIVIALINTTAILVLNRLLGEKPKEVTAKKGDIYECGVPYEGEGTQQFSVRYYVIGIIFLIFDVEVVFLYPWALVYKTFLSQGPMIIFEMVIFALILLGGYIYLRLRGAFDWD